MRSVPKRNFTTTRFLIGAVLLLLAIAFYYFSVLNVDYYKTGLLDLGWSDPSYYFAQAKAIMRDGYPVLELRLQKTAIQLSARLSGIDASLAQGPS